MGGGGQYTHRGIFGTPFWANEADEPARTIIETTWIKGGTKLKEGVTNKVVDIVDTKDLHLTNIDGEASNFG